MDAKAFRFVSGIGQVWELERPWFVAAVAGTTGLVLSAWMLVSQLQAVFSGKAAPAVAEVAIPLEADALADALTEPIPHVAAAAPPLSQEHPATKRPRGAERPLDTRFEPDRNPAEEPPLYVHVKGESLTAEPVANEIADVQPRREAPVQTAENPLPENVPWWDFDRPRNEGGPSPEAVDDFEPAPFEVVDNTEPDQPPAQTEPDPFLFPEPEPEQSPEEQPEPEPVVAVVVDDTPLEAELAESPPIDVTLAADEPAVADEPFGFDLPTEPLPEPEPEPADEPLVDFEWSTEHLRPQLTREQMAAAERSEELGVSATEPLPLDGLQRPLSDWLVARADQGTSPVAEPSYLTRLRRGEIEPQPLRSPVRPDMADVPSRQTVVLHVEATAPETAAVGSPIEHRIRVRNEGSAMLEWLALARPIPTLSELVDVSLPPAIGRNENLVWQFSPLEPGAENELSTSSRPGETGDHELRVLVEARASVGAMTTVRGPELNLQLAMWAEEKPVDGRHVRFRFLVKNAGTKVAENVSIVANVPENCSHRYGQALVARMGTLQPGQSRETDLVVTPNEPGEIVQKATLLSGETQCGSASAAVQFAPIQQTNAEAFGPRTAAPSSPKRLAQREPPPERPSTKPPAPRRLILEEDCWCLPLVPR